MSKEVVPSIVPSSRKEKVTPEKIDKPGTVLSRAFDRLIGKSRDKQSKKEKAVVKEEIKQAIVDIKKETLPKKSYDLPAAMKHFQSLHPEVKDALVNHFDTYFPGDPRGPYDLYDAIYKFQQTPQNGLTPDGIAGPATRMKIVEKNPGFLPYLTLDPGGTTPAGADILNQKVD